ncbi:MAG TPA: hypothetical protein VEU51_09685 [Candidatus Acidoferrales bacterium]|nr:hypothetical protein [Candidatus Acidoferrales bacterium]
MHQREKSSRLFVALAILIAVGSFGAGQSVALEPGSLQVPNPGAQQNELEIAPPAPQNQLPVSPPKPPTRANQSATIPTMRVDDALSRAATDNLHRHRLPYVNAQVLGLDPGVPAMVTLSGRVATQFGKQDAEKKTADFLRSAEVKFDNQIQIVPGLASGMVTPGNQAGTLTLPAAFYGCWRGTSYGSDSSAYLGGCAPGYEIPETTEWCFRRVGDSSYEITFQQASSAVPNFRERTDLVSSDGQNHIVLRSVGAYDLSEFQRIPVSYTSISNCDLLNGGATLACRGPSTYLCAGRPWYRKTGHVEMYRAAR